MKLALETSLRPITTAFPNDRAADWATAVAPIFLYNENENAYIGLYVLPETVKVARPEITLSQLAFPCLTSKVGNLNSLCKQQLAAYDVLLLQDDSNHEIGWIYTRELLVNNFSDLEHKYISLKTDLSAIMETDFTILDTDFRIVELSSEQACERNFDCRADELIGKTVFELVRKNVFRGAAVSMELKSGRIPQFIFTTRTGERLLYKGLPMHDDDGNVSRFIIKSKNISSVEALRNEFRSILELTDLFRREMLGMQNEDAKPFISQSDKMRHLKDLISRVAGVDSTVLVTGESGVGKELVVKEIHKQSRRSNEPFIVVNCGAIPEALIEAEFFGYEPGSFTGASRSAKPGIFEQANGGTLFLDEIGELPYELQTRLLRVLQERVVTRIGGTKTIPLDIRVIAATNRDLGKEVEHGRFRSDLYYRLHVIPLIVPPLRERRDEIGPLLNHYCLKMNLEYGFNKLFSADAIQMLEQYDWPGNVRELRNLVEQLCILTNTDVIQPEDLPPSIRTVSKQSTIQVSEIIPLKEAKKMVEKQLVQLASKKFSTTVEVASALKIDQSTASRKIQQYVAPSQ